MRNLNLPKSHSNSRRNRYSKTEVLVTKQPITIPIKSLTTSTTEWIELKVSGELLLQELDSHTTEIKKFSIPYQDLPDTLTLQANTYSEKLDDRVLEIEFFNSRRQRIATYNLSFTVVQICLDVDADRDGVVEENNPHKADWKLGKDGYGAIALVNSDRDITSQRQEPSSSDSRLNGILDIKDCSLMVVRRIGPKRLPSSCDVQVWVDEKTSRYLRIFDELDYSGHELVGPRHPRGTLRPTDLEKDLFLALEALHYRDLNFDGAIYINLSLVKDDDIIYTDRVRFQVAPWIMTPNHLSPRTVYILRTASGSNANLIDELRRVVGESKAQLEVVSSSAYRNDRWMQDEIEFGYSESPGHFMYVVLDSPRDRGLDDFPEQELLGFDVGHITRPNLDAGTLDSFGNLEVSPPVRVDGVDYPFGRILFGGDHPDVAEFSTRMVKNLRDFFYEQKIQSPIELFSDWLDVGHIDEFMTFVPISSGKGFKLLLASPNQYYKIIREFSQQQQRNMFQRYSDGEISLVDLLSDDQLFEDNKRFQDYIDLNRSILKDKLGLVEDDIIDLPALFESVDNGRAETYFPNMVNMLVLDSYLAIPKPFGPTINQQCQLEAFVRNVLEPFGFKCYFIDDWEPYFLGRGEIHCGTNTRRKPFDTKWWNFDWDG
ncbi:MAG: protein-arginine deiminase family protein [Crocosphaera sp.]|nr:protein-arginine deiminase family protein [Crocosphaera sp.]